MRLREVETHIYWHGSDIKDLKKLEPQDSVLVGGKVVFAAIYPEIAVAMSGHWDDSDFVFGRSMKKDDDPDEIPYTFREKREGAFEEFFSDPISLYEVDGKSFRSDPEIQDFEVVSNKTVKVLDEHRIEHPLDYLHKSRMVKLKTIKKTSESWEPWMNPMPTTKYVIMRSSRHLVFVGDGKRWSSRMMDGQIFIGYNTVEDKIDELRLQYPKLKRDLYSQQVGSNW